MEKFDSQNLRMLRTEIESALSDVLGKHGIKPTLGTIRFSSLSCKVSLEMKLAGTENAEDGGLGNAADKAEFELYATRFGLKPEDFGKKFVSRGYLYTITGIKPSRPKFPVSAVRSDGKGFKFPAGNVRLALLGKLTTSA